MDHPPAIAPQPQDRYNNTRTKPRTPLQERTQSETNEDSSRLGRDGRYGQNVDIFSATPFPTKPQHILLPSTIRKQRSFQNEENLLPTFFARGHQGGNSRPTTAATTESEWDESKGRRAPVLQLKRSVSTLRDMYEAQAEKSRPSTAASYAFRPGTASSRLRSASSSEGLAGRSAWEELHKISADDMALLPSMTRSSLERLASDASFATRAAHNPNLMSTPNYRTYGTSSPKMPIFQDESTLSSGSYHQTSSSGLAETSSSSPNFVRLGRSSSIVDTLNTEQSSSSPNFVKLGTSSPGLRTSSSPTPSTASDESRKRKRSEIEPDTSYANRLARFNSSPPYAVIQGTTSVHSLTTPVGPMPSSPPEPDSIHSQSIGTSSPNYKTHGTPHNASDSDSSSSAHANLQAALSSSPMPPIQYPVIRAPAAVASSLNVPKRISRSSSAEHSNQWISRLSPVPSEWDEGLSRSGSKRSYQVDNLDEIELQRSDSIVPESTGNDSQVNIVLIADDDHQHEATDELGALPRRRGLAYRSPPLVPVRTNSLFGTKSHSTSNSNSNSNHSQSRLNSLRTSVDTRLNSMRSFTHSRQNSFMSGSVRPSSSGSQSTSIIVPTWARRYYSGFYHDSFQYLYPSQTNSASQLPAPINNPRDRSTSIISNSTQPVESTAASRNSGRSWQAIRTSFRNSLQEYLPSIMIPKNRPRLEARKSHLTMGVGPLVSNPVNPEIVHTRTDPHRSNPTVRRISEQLPAADPRAHWAGITEEQSDMIQNYTPYHSSRQVNRESGESESIYYDASSGQYRIRNRFDDGPHLHHDRRLNTGSSRSRGFGFPFNQKSRYGAPSVYDGATRPSWFKIDLRDAQVTCFIIGFIIPITWFVGAFLPLPPRPDSFDDIEKTVYDQQPSHADEMDIIARLRLERHIKGVEELRWQNARWWKRMNRWMCIVGIVVFILIIILAVIGTRNHW